MFQLQNPVKIARKENPSVAVTVVGAVADSAAADVVDSVAGAQVVTVADVQAVTVETVVGTTSTNAFLIFPTLWGELMNNPAELPERTKRNFLEIPLFF